MYMVVDYYEAKDICDHSVAKEKECGSASERISAVINELGFALSPEYLKSVHKKLFGGFLEGAGKYRDINIRKHEWVLDGESVDYASKDDIEALVKSDFENEDDFDHSGLDATAKIQHVIKFVSRLWQRHPFINGNTRTIAVFTIKYLQVLGFQVNNNMFKEYSWFFRNALVRANYENHLQLVTKTFEPLSHFFGNLLLGENNELKSRLLLVEFTSSQIKMEGHHKKCKCSGNLNMEVK